MCRRLLLCLFLLLQVVSSWAQLPTNERKKNIQISDTIVLDTLSIFPGSYKIIMNGIEVPADIYSVDCAKGLLCFDLQKVFNLYGNERDCEISYRVFPILFSKKIQDEQKHSLVIQKSDTSGNNTYVYNLNHADAPANEIFKWEGINKSGSFTRGVSFGNSRDATVISAFNLQLSGKLNNDVEILASITDENVPIQPNGNTQTLQDFDRIFIQISKGASKAIGGDFSITRPKSKFMNMFKRTQGLSLSTTVWNKNIFKNEDLFGGVSFKVEGGVARGKFKRQEIQGVEGNQGPYRLSGNDGESLIIILSGSESIYIDGQKLERGQENDYIIDYNTAEITFTARQIITKDKRIIIEFEYSDRKYQRWMAHFSNEWNYKKISYRLNYYGEFDDKNASLIQTLSDDDRLVMYNIGDTLLSAYSPAIDSVGFNTNEILYKQIDTVVNATLYTIYDYSVDPDSAHYRLSFSDLGEGNGDYILLNSSANGRVFKWLAPNVDGSKNGRYEPVIKLVTPKIQQMVTAAFDYRINPNILLSAEGAFSHYDQNTFSPFDSKDDLGYAIQLDGKFRFPLVKKEKDTLSLNIDASYQQVSSNFKPIIRFRDVEFERDWNFLNRNNPNATYNNVLGGDDYLPSIIIELKRRSWGSLKYEVEAYFKPGLYSAYKNDFRAVVGKKGWTFHTLIRQTSTLDTLNHTLFLRHSTKLSKRFSIFEIGLNGIGEYNTFNRNATDSLLTNSYAFNDWEIYLANGDSVKQYFRVFYKNRIDHLAGDNRLKFGAMAHHAGLEFRLNNIKNQLLKSTITYRYLQIVDTTVLKKSDESTLLGRIEYNGNFVQNAIQLNLFYETGSGLENKRDYQYIQALNGQGTHVWIDYNGDGIQQRDEFEIQSGTIVGTDGLTYIAYYFPTSDFIKTYYNQFTLTFNLQAPSQWKKQKGVKKFLSRVSLQTAFRSDRKTQKNDFASSLNPFGYNDFDTALVYSNYSLRQTLYFNRFSSAWALELNYNDVNNKSLFSNGIDSRSNRYFSSRIRINITRMISLNTSFKFGYKSNLSQLLTNRNYNLRYLETPNELFIQPNTKWRVGLNYRFAMKDNIGFVEDTTISSGQRTIIHDAGVTLRTNFILKGQLSVKFNYINIAYNDPDNNALAFEMLEGLKTGSNFTWGASFQRTIGKNLQLSINYDGRKSDNANFIHLASMQIRAFF